MEDLQVPKSILITVQQVLAEDAQSVLQMEMPVGSESFTRVWRVIRLGDF